MAKTRKQALKNRRSRKHGGDGKRRAAQRRARTREHEEWAKYNQLKERLAKEKKVSDETVKRVLDANEKHKKAADNLMKLLAVYPE